MTIKRVLRVAPVRAALTCAVTLVATAAAGQGVPPGTYRPNPADEDWTFLKDAPRTDRWDPLKYIELGPEGWSLTLNGEFRLRPEGFRVRKTAARPSTVDNYLLQRYIVGADLRFGRRFRFYADLQSGIINGQLRSPRPTDKNQLDLHQALIEYRQPVRQRDQVTFIFGRQELEIGSSRLISASPGLNVKRSFDGFAVGYRTPSWYVAGAGAGLVALESGLFDDRADPEQRFWGIAASRRGRALGRGEFGAYYLGIDKTQSVYAQGLGPEVRHTVGFKWSAANTRVDLNYDVMFQWGRFAGASIGAWAFATETGFRFAGPWRPRVSIRMDLASGDDDAASPTLESFNPLFPGNAYSGAVGLLGPTNLTDLTPSLTVTPRRNLTLGFEAPSYWRTSTGDGVYSTDQRVLFGPGAGGGNYVGTNPGIVAVWQATRHIQFQGAVTRFLPGRFLDDTFVSAGFGFYSVTARYRF